MRARIFHQIIAVGLLLLTVALAYGGPEAANPGARKYGGTKTLFVVDMVRDGAKANSEKDIDQLEVFGVKKGQLTAIGREEASKLGAKRRIQYTKDKKLLPFKYNESAILSLTTHKPTRCKESGQKIIQAMYPLTDLAPKREVTYLTLASPLKGTSFE